MNKILKILISSLLVSLIPLNSFSEEENSDKEVIKHDQNYKGLGVTAGLLSGLGFSYRQFFADRLGYKLTGVAFFDNNQLFSSVGIQGMYVISENELLRFYSLIGVSNYTSRRSYSNGYVYPTDSSYENVYIPPVSHESYNSFGGGIGLEIGRSNNGLSLAVEVPLIFSFKGFTVSSFYPIPQISLFYNF